MLSVFYHSAVQMSNRIFGLGVCLHNQPPGTWVRNAKSPQGEQRKLLGMRPGRILGWNGQGTSESVKQCPNQCGSEQRGILIR